MNPLNIASITVTDQDSSATTTTATSETPSDGHYIQVVGFSGSSSDQAVKVELKFGSTVKMTMYAAAATPTGHFFEDDGPVAAVGETVSVVTTLTSGESASNLIYRIRQ